MRFLTTALALLVVVATASAQKEFTDDAARVVKALTLRTGQTVADIGAGGGQLTILLAREVGPSGRVYATEVNAERLRGIDTAAREAGVTNVTTIEGHASRTNLPDTCCDAIVVRFVYHHFKDPAAMNASLLQSLRPGGLLAVIEFLPDGPESSDPAARGDDPHHGVSAATVERELKQAGFELLTTDNAIRKSSFMVVARRP
jgi:ubiquinone/menaquinone biosynthesis C-methylase UbiE